MSTPKDELNHAPSHVSAVDIDKEGLEAAPAVPKPESFASMTPEELKTLEKKMVRKMDSVIL